MVKIKVIVPINHSGINETISQEIQSLKLPELEISISNLTSGPTFIENRYQDYLAYDCVIQEALLAAKEDYDGILIDVFTDTAIDILRELIDIPVVGGFLPSLLQANLIAQKYSIVTALPEVVPIYEGLSRQIGQNFNLVSIRNVQRNICQMTDIEALSQELLKESHLALAEGAQSIILGCTGMLGVSQKVEQALQKEHGFTPVINPTWAGLTMLYGLIAQKLTHSRQTYGKAQLKLGVAQK